MGQQQHHSQAISSEKVDLSLFQGEAYMSKEILAVLKKSLVEWKRSIIIQSDLRLAAFQDVVEQPSSDLSDQATLEENMSLHVRARERERKLIQKIDQSIALIERGDYGYCDECGVEIGYERMLARLTATMCIDCKTAAEVKEKHSGC